MRLSCSILIEHVLEQRARASKPKFVESDVELIKVPDRHAQILVWTNKGASKEVYDVTNIENLRTTFMSNGMLTIVTIQMKDPLLNLLIKNCNPMELIEFHKQIVQYLTTATDSFAPKDEVASGNGEVSGKEEEISENRKEAFGNDKETWGNGKEASGNEEETWGNGKEASGNGEETFENIKHGEKTHGNRKEASKNGEETLGNRKKASGKGEVIFGNRDETPENRKASKNENGGKVYPQDSCSNKITGVNRGLSGVKRSYKEVSVFEIEVPAKKKKPIRRTVRQVKQYPKRNFHPLTEFLSIHIQLAELDYKILTLSHLRELDLSCNAITSIEPLRHLKSSLLKLVLSNNAIEVVPDDLFLAKSFANLMSLHLNENKLKAVPSSILELKNLIILRIDRNQIDELPYNLCKLRRLRYLKTLKMNGNLLKFLPITICPLKLNDLDFSDNCFTKCASGDKKIKVAMSNFPTLFELAVENIATYNFNRNSNIHILIPVEKPKVTEYMNACKFCIRCSRMSLRYTISHRIVENRHTAAVTITSTSEPSKLQFPAMEIICSQCTKFSIDNYFLK